MGYVPINFNRTNRETHTICILPLFRLRFRLSNVDRLEILRDKIDIDSELVAMLVLWRIIRV
jgi:hypothetical protein